MSEADKNPSVVTGAVLLAAGRGKRLHPHTDYIPKPLLIHRGKPTLDYLLDSLLEAGIHDVILVTHYLHEQMERYAALRSLSHESHAGESSVSMKELDPTEMASRSSVRFNEDQSIAEIVEKPAAGSAPSSIGANLTFVLPPEIVPFVQGVPMSARGEQEVQHAINAWIDNGGLAFGLVQPVPSEWQPPTD